MSAPARTPRRRRIPRWLWWLAVLPVSLVALGVAGLLTVLLISLPLPPAPAGPALLLDAQGAEFARLSSDVARRDVTLTELPQHAIDAVVAAEDGDFYTHIGIDPRSVARAVVSNLRSREVTQGGSTITQQYIKVASGNNAQTVWRKLTEAALALKLERTHTKDEILQMYLNSVYFGRGAYGIQAAAQAYYGIDASQLTLPQSAVLAGVLPAPSVYDPAVDNRASHLRYRYVLEQMTVRGLLTAEQRDALFAEQPPVLPQRRSSRDDAPWFTDLVRRELEELGFADGAGLTVHTTLNLGVQRHAERAYEGSFPTEDAVGALVSVDPATGGVLALVGGADYAEDQLNLALATRQPGSTYKPVALAAWLDAGRSVEEVMGAPGSVTVPAIDAGSDWTVSNYGGADLGSMSIRRATWRSSNTVYAQMVGVLGVDEVASMADRLIGMPGENPAIASLVLGTHEVSPLTMASMYATFAAQGVRRPVHAIREVWEGDRLRYRAAEEGEQVLDPDHAAVLTDVLTGVVTDGTGASAAIGRPVAGKTGTTQDHGDAWFAGYTPQVATVVWMGHRDDRGALAGRETGGGLPAAIFGVFMRTVHEGLEVVGFPLGTSAPAPAPTTTATPTPTATATPSETETEAPPTAVPSPQDSPTEAPTRPAAPRPTREPEPSPEPAPTSPAPTRPPAEPTAEPQPAPPPEPVGTPTPVPAQP